MTYPQLHHLGFKMMCGFMFLRTLNYMVVSEYHLASQTTLLETIRNNTRK
jgi:hypothetical protein